MPDRVHKIISRESMNKREKNTKATEKVLYSYVHFFIQMLIASSSLTLLPFDAFLIVIDFIFFRSSSLKLWIEMSENLQRITKILSDKLHTKIDQNSCQIQFIFQSMISGSIKCIPLSTQRKIKI